MNTKMERTILGRRGLGLGMLIALGAAVLAVSGTGCSQSEGSECNIGLSHDECSGAPNTQCMIPAGCCNAAVLTNGEVQQTFGVPSCSVTAPMLAAIGRTSNAYCCSPGSTEPQCQPCVFAVEDGGAEGGPDASSTTEAGADSAVEAGPDTTTEAGFDGAPESGDSGGD